MTDPLYTARATVTGGRNGEASSESGRLHVKLSNPLAPGRPDVGTDPEELFAAGYGACFSSALMFVARQRKIDLPEPPAAKVTIHLLKREEGGFTLGAEMDVTVPGVSHEVAQSLAEEAHTVCPYSNATKASIAIKLTARGV